MGKHFNYSYIVEKNQEEYTLDNTTEEQVVSLLIEKNINISTAESITGGLLGGRIVNIPGASNIYEEGYITYSNRIKNKVLKVETETLSKYSAVSQETCCEMLVNLKKIANTKSAIVTTGYAGPGELEGIAFIGVNYEKLYTIKKFKGECSRNVFRNKVVDIGLSSIYNFIKNI